MWINGRVERSRGSRLLSAVVAWFGALLAAAILSDVFVARLPTPGHAEGSAPAFVSVCFQGPVGGFLGIAYLGQRCR
jgi:hypothetical protein